MHLLRLHFALRMLHKQSPRQGMPCIARLYKPVRQCSWAGIVDGTATTASLILPQQQAHAWKDVQMVSFGEPTLSRGAFLGQQVHTAPLRPSHPHSVHQGSAIDQQRVTSSQKASTSGDNSRNLSSRGKSSTRAWQHQWRYMRSERARTDQSLPKIDWTRYHLQVSL